MGFNSGFKGLKIKFGSLYFPFCSCYFLFAEIFNYLSTISVAEGLL